MLIFLTCVHVWLGSGRKRCVPGKARTMRSNRLARLCCHRCNASRSPLWLSWYPRDLLTDVAWVGCRLVVRSGILSSLYAHRVHSGGRLYIVVTQNPDLRSTRKRNHQTLIAIKNGKQRRRNVEYWNMIFGENLLCPPSSCVTPAVCYAHK